MERDTEREKARERLTERARERVCVCVRAVEATALLFRNEELKLKLI
jgi:hypothetical protein